MNRQRWLGILRLIFSLALAAWAINAVVSRAGANLSAEFRQLQWAWVAMCLVLTTIGTALSSYRWCSLLALQGVVVSQWEAFRLTMIGVFFNLFGLGGVGGDIFKMYCVKAHAGSRHGEAMLSILVDRILGLLGLFVVALVSLCVVWDDLARASATVKTLLAFVVGVSVVGGGAVTAVLTRDLWLPAALKGGIRALARRLPEKLVRLVARVVRSLDLYRAHLPQVFGLLGLSALVHSMATLSVICIARAFSIEGIATKFYFIAVQVANTVSAVPITPGGLGSRDFVLQEFLTWGGGEQRCSLIPFGLSAVLVTWSLVGGIFFLLEPKKGIQNAETMDAGLVDPDSDGMFGPDGSAAYLDQAAGSEPGDGREAEHPDRPRVGLLRASGEG